MNTNEYQTLSKSTDLDKERSILDAMVKPLPIQPTESPK